MVTDALRQKGRDNKALEAVIGRHDFNAADPGARILDDNTLAELIRIPSQRRLGQDDLEPDILRRPYEFLIRRITERGSAAGEFFTPQTVGYQIARVIDPPAGGSIIDRASGSATPPVYDNRCRLKIRSLALARSARCFQRLSNETDSERRFFGP